MKLSDSNIRTPEVGCEIIVKNDDLTASRYYVINVCFDSHRKDREFEVENEDEEISYFGYNEELGKEIIVTNF
jgi:hypothetical protein